MELRFYLIDTDNTDIDVINASKKQFVEESERQGTVYSLEGFQKAFNQGSINSHTDQLRIFSIEPVDIEIQIEEELFDEHERISFDVSIIDETIEIHPHSYEELARYKGLSIDDTFKYVEELTNKYKSRLW